MKGKEDGLSAEDLAGMQLMLRVVVWDLADINREETARLERELEIYGISRYFLTAGTKGDAGKCTAACALIYDKMCRQLEKDGYAATDTVLITEDAQLAKYVHGLKSVQPFGMAVVYYEKIYNARMPAGQNVSYSKRNITVQNAQEPEHVSADMIVQGFEEIGVQFLERVLKRRNGLPWTILYTERTYVREMALSDLDELYELYGGDGITDYTEPLYERQKEEEYTKSYINYMYHYYGYGMWVVRDRKTGNLIGRAGIEHHEEHPNEVLMELGYIIGQQYQRQGYAVEVCRAIIEYAEDELEIDQLHCFIHPQNTASIRVAEKLGFHRVSKDQDRQEKMIHFCRQLYS